MKEIFNSLFFRTVTIIIVVTGQVSAQIWTKTTPAASSLWAVWGLDANNVWASGNSGTLSKWNGTSWSSFSIDAITGQRFGLWGSSTSNIYSVGGTTGQQIANFNGTSWSLISSAITTWGTGSARSVWGSSATDVWIVGGAGRALRYNGTSWGFQSTGLPNTLSGAVVWGLNATNVWIGGSVGAASTGTIYKWNAGTSTWVQEISDIRTIRSIWGATSTDIWAVGGDGPATGGRIYHSNGTTWTDVTPAGSLPTLYGVWGQNATNIWAIGDGGTILKWDGTSWEAQSSGSTSDLRSIFGAGSSTNLWTVAEAASNNALTSAQTPLPLSLISFSAQTLEKQILLKWSTVQEKQTDKFEIESASSDLKFHTLTSLQTTGNDLNKQNEYSYKFTEAETGKDYYFRLKMIDLDGKFAYSRIIKANVKSEEHSFFYPNPASEKIQLNAGEIQNSSKLEILDANGNLVISRKNDLKESIDIRPLSAGNYFIRLFKKDGTQTSKLLSVQR